MKNIILLTVIVLILICCGACAKVTGPVMPVTATAVWTATNTPALQSTATETLTLTQTMILTETSTHTPVQSPTLNVSPTITVTATTTRTPVTGTELPVISQIYGGGGALSAPYLHDYIKLYNRGTAAVDLSAYSIQYTSAAGTTWMAHALSGTLQPGAYYLIRCAAGSTSGISIDVYDIAIPLNIGSAHGRIALVKSLSALGSSICPLPDVLIYDYVGYGTAICYEGTAAVGALSVLTAAIRNSGGVDDTDQNASDFTIAAPNP